MPSRIPRSGPCALTASPLRSWKQRSRPSFLPTQFLRHYGCRELEPTSAAPSALILIVRLFCLSASPFRMDCMDDRTYNRRRFGPAVYSRFRDSLVGVWGMKRRTFLGSLALLPAALAVQEGPPEADPVEQFTTPALPTIALSHLGFRPEVSKTL